MSDGSTFVSRHCWTNSVHQFDPKPYYSQHCIFKCQDNIKQGNLQMFDDSHLFEQDVENMTAHQSRVDNGMFLLLSLIPLLFNHASQFDAQQLVNMLFSFSTNLESEEGPICII